MAFFKISLDDVKRLQGGDGSRLASVINNLLRADAAIAAVSQSKLHTNETAVRDGGVDAHVSTRIPGNEYCTRKTCWQFKATTRSKVGSEGISPTNEVRKLLKGEFVEELIGRGYAFRLVLTDDLPGSWMDNWQTMLREEARKINSKAPEPIVIAADKIEAWVNSRPAIIPELGLRRIPLDVRALTAWGRTITKATKKYVPNPALADARDAIRAHCDLSQPAEQVVQPVHGLAGAGKTRLVYEVLNEDQSGNVALVLYTTSKDAVREIANSVVSEPEQKAIVIADELEQGDALALERDFGGHQDCLRIVSIDNASRRLRDGRPDLEITKLDEATLRDVLRLNFESVPEEHRSRYAKLAGGYVFFAADLCKNHELILEAGHHGATLATVEDYLQLRLRNKPAQWNTLLAVSLVRKLGVIGSVKAQAIGLFTKLNLSPPEDYVVIARDMHDTPGFIRRAGDYVYVTPEIVTEAVFRIAWEKWADGREDVFLNDIPPELISTLQDRVKVHGTQEARRRLGDYFRDEIANLDTADLKDPDAVKRLVNLVDTNPDQYFPVLVSLIESASNADLNPPDATNRHGWGARRPLVWLLEQMMAFPEWVNDCESLLLKLAKYEAEPAIANNATGIWKQIYKVGLSGTPLPFQERIEILRSRLNSSDPGEVQLALDALKGAIFAQNTRMGRPDTVAGRIVPPEWSPSTNLEMWEELNRAIALLVELTRDSRVTVAEQARETIILHVRHLLEMDALDLLMGVLHVDQLTDSERLNLIEHLDETIHFDSKMYQQSERGKEYLFRIQEWRASLIPDSMEGRLKVAIGKDPWHHDISGGKEEWEAEIDKLAAWLVGEPSNLLANGEWFHSGEAKGARFLGHAIAKLDREGTLLAELLELAKGHDSSGLAGGYVSYLLSDVPQLRKRVNECLDDLCETNPNLAFDLSWGSGAHANPLERSLRLVDSGAIPATRLRVFAYGTLGAALSPEDLVEILKRLMPLVRNGDVDAYNAALECVSFRLQKSQIEGARPASDYLQNKEVESFAWELLESDLIQRSSEEYDWDKIARAFTEKSPQRGLIAIARALGSENFDLDHFYVIPALAKYAAVYPEETMQAFGSALLEGNARSYLFQIHVYRTITHDLPVSAVREWLDEKGLEGARALARHLCAPYLDESGAPVVPDVTLEILTRYGTDEDVMDSFMAGTGSWEEVRGGDLAAYYDRDAETANAFLNHKLKPVRDWAHAVKTFSVKAAAKERKRQEEEKIDN